MTTPTHLAARQAVEDIHQRLAAARRLPLGYSRSLRLQLLRADLEAAYDALRATAPVQRRGDETEF